MKKALKFISIFIIIIVVLLITIPSLFKKQINDLIQTKINESVNATVNFEDLDISLIKHFPNPTITLHNLSVIPHTPFEKDTLVFSEYIQLQAKLSRNFLSNPEIQNIAIENASIVLKTNKEGKANYDISKETTTTEIEVPKEKNDSSDLQLEIENYTLENIDFTYIDESSNLEVFIKDFNHNGNGTASTNSIVLDTKSTVESFTFAMDNTKYISKAKIDYDATFDINLDNTKVTFKENSAHLNDLAISFHGFVQPTDEGIVMDLDFTSEKSEFKSLLSLIPSAYSSNFSGVKAKGSLDFHGEAKGIYNDTEIPEFSVIAKSENASFKYPDLPKSIENIYINTTVENTTGVMNDILVDIKNISFKIDEDAFSASSKITNVIENPTIAANFEGTMNLGNLSQAYPVELDLNLQGILTAHLNTAFNLKAIEKNKYQEIKNKGSLALENFNTETELLPNPIFIEKTLLEFNSGNFHLEEFKAKTGTSDLSVKGNIKNLYGYVFSDKDLKGNFTLNSNNLKIGDLLSATDSTATTETKIDSTQITNTEAIKIPAKIDAIVKMNAKKVVYDNMLLEEVIGTLKIKDQKAIFEKTSAKMFKGSIAIEGSVDTKPTPSNFDLQLNVKDFDIAESFNSVELLSSLVPFAKSIDGKMSTNFNLKGLLDNDFFPDTKSLSGDALANLNVTKVDAKQSKAMSLLDDKVSFVDFSKLNLKKVKAKLNFADQKVQFQPFQLATYEGMPITMSGSHSFENKMDYKLNMDLPAKYFGNEVANLLSSLSATEKNKLTVPFTIAIGGAVTKPSVKPDMKSATTALTSKIVSSQKSKLVYKVTNSSQAKKLLDNVLGTSNKEKDSTNTSKKTDLKKAAGKLLKGLF